MNPTKAAAIIALIVTVILVGYMGFIFIRDPSSAATHQVKLIEDESGRKGL